MTRSLRLLFVLVALSFALAVPAHAYLITVSFTVQGNPDDLANAGATSNGSFSFDSSLIPVGGGFLPNGNYETSLSLLWDGTAWGPSNANLMTLMFDAGGNLTAWSLGGHPTTPGSVGAFTNADDILLSASGGTGNFTYARQGNTTRLYGSAFTYTVTTNQTTEPTAVPEPASWMLMAGGLVGVALARRRNGGA